MTESSLASILETATLRTVFFACIATLVIFVAIFPGYRIAESTSSYHANYNTSSLRRMKEVWMRRSRRRDGKSIFKGAATSTARKESSSEHHETWSTKAVNDSQKKFAGHKDKDLLAAVGLGISFGNAFGFTLVIGVERAFQTLCSQAFGAGNFRRMGILLQRSFVLLFISSFPFLAIWVNAEVILRGFGQEEKLCRTTGKFLMWYMPSIWLLGGFRLLASFLACQHSVYSQLIAGIVACATSAIANCVLSFVVDAGIAGYAISNELAILAGCLVLVVNIKCSAVIQSWQEWSSECLEEWGQFATLAIPSGALVFLDWGGSEAGVILMGLLGTINLGTMSAGFSILSLLFVFCQGISMAACVLVGNALGARDLEHAKASAKAAVLVTVAVTTTFSVLLLLCKNYIGYIFTSHQSVIELLSHIIPILAAYHFVDANAATLHGILIGLGLQMYTAPIALFGYDCVGLPLGIVFAFVLKMRLFGYWCGQLCGAFCVALMSILIVIKSNWKKCQDLAIERAKIKDIDQYLEKDSTKEIDSEDDNIPLVANGSLQNFSGKKSRDENLHGIYGRVAFVAFSFLLFLVGIAIRLYSG